MNKLILAIVIIAILLFGGFYLFSGGEDSGDSGGEDFDKIPDSDFVNLETSEDVFNELDLSLEFIE
jgi:hypothetical protein